MMSLALLFHYLMLNMFRMLVHPSSQHDVTCFIISLFKAQHVSNVSTSILRRLRLIVGLSHVLYCSVRIEVLALVSHYTD